jgi:putative MATE family efflux protein
MSDNNAFLLTKGPILKPLIAFSFPIMLTNILQLLFNAADIIVVGQFVDETAVAAVGSNTALINLLINLFVGISLGATVTISIKIGAKQDSELPDIVHTAVAMGVLFGVIMAAVGFLGARTFLTWMSTPSDVIDQASLYLQIYFCGTPAFMIYTFGRSVLVPTGDTKRPLLYLTISGILNVILNLILVIVFHLGVAGVAIATVVSQILSAVLMMRALFRLEGPCRIYPEKIRIHRKPFSAIVRLGLPAGLQSAVFSISNVMIQSSVNSLGTAYVAGNSAANSLEGFVYSSMDAFSQGCMTFSGQNFGARRFDRLNRVYGISILCNIVIGVALGGLTCLFAVPLLRIYLPEAPAALTAGTGRLFIIVAFDFICGCMNCTTNMLRGMGKSVFPMIATIVGCCGLRIVWIFTIFRSVFATGNKADAYHALLISYPVSWILSFAALFIFYAVTKRKLGKPGIRMPEVTD